MKIVLLLMKCFIIISMIIPILIASIMVSVIVLFAIFVMGMIWVCDSTTKFVNKTFDS